MARPCACCIRSVRWTWWEAWWSVIVREWRPSAALVVLARVGTPTVVELGTARAQGEVEALEALGIDPIHYLVPPRVVGITVAVFALSVFLLVFAVFSGWLVSVVANLPPPAGYLAQIVRALRWQDFPLLAAKSLTFGGVGALIACYQGLARPLRLEEVPGPPGRWRRVWWRSWSWTPCFSWCSCSPSHECGSGHRNGGGRGRHGSRVAPLLSGVTWSVRSGEFWVVTGTHGAGKSLLLETMAGIQPCRGGDIRWFGNRPGTPEDSESGRARWA